MNKRAKGKSSSQTLQVTILYHPQRSNYYHLFSPFAKQQTSFCALSQIKPLLAHPPANKLLATQFITPITKKTI